MFNLTSRPRRNRRFPWLRDLVAEYNLCVSDLVQPIFVIDGKNKEEQISTLPGITRRTIDLTIAYCQELVELGIKAIALFPVIDASLKSENGEEAFNEDNLICRTIKEIKDNIPNLGVICDVALDPYTISGHDGIVYGNVVDNDLTVEALCKQAITLSQAGCDIVAPSDMMDGRIIAIRESLDDAGFTNTGILSYAAKYASCLYGPFRDAVNSKNQLAGKDKKTYQMDFRNSLEAQREVLLDIEEGADIIMVKPASFYLDIIAEARHITDIPVAAYQVSGEYAMLKMAAASGIIDEKSGFLEALTSIKRAGASIIFTYYAHEMAKFLNK